MIWWIERANNFLCTGNIPRTAKTRAGKRFLENKAPKLRENTKKIMFMCSQHNVNALCIYIHGDPFFIKGAIQDNRSMIGTFDAHDHNILRV